MFEVVSPFGFPGAIPDQRLELTFGQGAPWAVVLGAFALALGFSVLAWLAGRKAIGLAAHAAQASLRVLRPVWEPTRAFLSRGKPARGAGAHGDRWAESVEKELGQGDDDGRPGALS